MNIFDSWVQKTFFCEVEKQEIGKPWLSSSKFGILSLLVLVILLIYCTKLPFKFSLTVSCIDGLWRESSLLASTLLFSQRHLLSSLFVVAFVSWLTIQWNRVFLSELIVVNIEDRSCFSSTIKSCFKKIKSLLVYYSVQSTKCDVILCNY